MAFKHTNSKGTTYILHSNKTKAGHDLYFFAKDERPNAVAEKPAGYEVSENAKTGLPFLKKA